MIEMYNDQWRREDELSLLRSASTLLDAGITNNGHCIDVKTGDREALVISVSLSPREDGPLFHVIYHKWNPRGGIEYSTLIAECRLSVLPAVVESFVAGAR